MLGAVSLRLKRVPVGLGNAKTEPALAPATTVGVSTRPDGASFVSRSTPATSDHDPPPLVNEYSRTLPMSSPANARSLAPTMLPGDETEPASPRAPVLGAGLPSLSETNDISG